MITISNKESKKRIINPKNQIKFKMENTQKEQDFKFSD